MSMAVYSSTPITSHRTAPSGSETTMNAATSTPGIPPMVSPRATRRSNRPAGMKRAAASGSVSAADPIMIGKAAIGFMPRRLTSAMQGA